MTRILTTILPIKALNKIVESLSSEFEPMNRQIAAPIPWDSIVVRNSSSISNKARMPTSIIVRYLVATGISITVIILLAILPIP